MSVPLARGWFRAHRLVLAGLGACVVAALVVAALTKPSAARDWFVAETLVGVAFMGVCLIRRRISYWPVVVALLVGDLFRALGNRSEAWSPGGWGIAYGGAMPLVPGIVLFVFYASFAVVPLAILVFSDRTSAKAAAVTALIDGLIHLALPVKPPWMVGASTRWGAGQPFIGSSLSKDINPLAALPSLHVALPASQKWNWWALAISVAVVLLGEHWLIDVFSGWALGLGSRWAVQRFWREVDVGEPTEVVAAAPAEPDGVAAA